MTIQPIKNQTVASLYLPELLQRVPSLFINICGNFDPQTMKNFLLTCKTIRQINSNFKKSYPLIYSKFLSQIFPHGFFQKSLEELSHEMVELCKNTDKLWNDNHSLWVKNRRQELSEEEITQYQKLQFFELKDLLNALNASGKFDTLEKDKLEEAFSSACLYTHSHMVELFIHSDRYQDISVECLNKSFGSNAPRDDGETIRMLINSNRFHEITPKSLGDALQHASKNGHPGVVQAIIESGRAHEISSEAFSEAFFWAAANGEDSNERPKLQTLLILMDFPQFNTISAEDLGKAFEYAASGRMEAIIKSSRFHEISKERLNKAFHRSMNNFAINSAYALITSGRFNEITVDYLDKSLPLQAGSRDDGRVIKALVKTEHFQKIRIESIGKTLEEAAYNENPETLRALLNSNRFAEIPLENFSLAVYRAAGLGFINHTVPLENLTMLMNTQQFSQLDPEDLGKIFLHAIDSQREQTINIQYSDRKDAIRFLLRSERFREIGISQVIEAVHKLIEKKDVKSLRIFRDSGRFHEIDSELQEACNAMLDLPAL